MLYPIALRAQWIHYCAPRPVGYPERLKKPQEVEVKIAVRSALAARAKLRAAGFRLRSARVLEQNMVLDDGQGSLRAKGLLLRLRRAGKKIVCTFKGPAARGVHKRRDEYEFEASDLNACVAVFGGLGLRPSFLYEKYRAEFERAGEAGHVTVDETPIGVFMELEGPARWIDATAKDLGFGRAEYITASYTTLYFAWCREHEVAPGNMVFGKTGRD